MSRPISETEIRHLPDTPINRRLIARWAEQDQRGIQLQRTLFNNTEPDPATPIPQKRNDTCDVTFQIQQATEEASAELTDQTFVDREIVSRMTAGSSRSRTFSAADVAQHMMSSINILLEFPKVYDQKKNKCAAVMSFVKWLKKHEHFKWLTGETGDELREALANLATDLMAEYLAPPKLVAAVQMGALLSSEFHKNVFISDFHCGMCHVDSDFGKFQDACAGGVSDDSVLTFVHPSILPGFDRLTGANSAEHWVDMATAVIDSASFLDITSLEKVYTTNMSRWKQFQIGSQLPKLAKSKEQEIFSALMASAERAGLTVISEPDRAQHLLQGISLTVSVYGKYVTVQELIHDAIAAAKLGRAAVTRKFVFEQYEEQYAFHAHRAPGSGGGHHRNAKDPLAMQPDDAAVLIAGAQEGIMIKCKDCAIQFEFTVGQQEFFKKKCNDSKPSRCDPCSKKNKERMKKKPCHQFAKTGSCSFGDRCRFSHEPDAVLCVGNDSDEQSSESSEWSDDRSDYDSDEGKPWRY
jgi:hypothetical protein